MRWWKWSGRVEGSGEQGRLLGESASATVPEWVVA